MIDVFSWYLLTIIIPKQTEISFSPNARNGRCTWRRDASLCLMRRNRVPWLLCPLRFRWTTNSSRRIQHCTKYRYKWYNLKLAYTHNYCWDLSLCIFSYRFAIPNGICSTIHKTGRCWANCCGNADKLAEKCKSHPRLRHSIAVRLANQDPQIPKARRSFLLFHPRIRRHRHKPWYRPIAYTSTML